MLCARQTQALAQKDIESALVGRRSSSKSHGIGPSKSGRRCVERLRRPIKSRKQRRTSFSKIRSDFFICFFVSLLFVFLLFVSLFEREKVISKYIFSYHPLSVGLGLPVPSKGLHGERNSEM